MNIQEYVDLAPLVTMKVSGKARYFVVVETIEELIEAIKWAHERTLLVQILAGGSNILFALDLFDGLVIKMAITAIHVKGNTIKAGAGAPINRLLLAAKEHSLGGLAPFSGLPGTVGGAVRGNAGCYGTETKNVISEVTVLNEKQELVTLTNADMCFGYRHSRIKETGEIIVEATYVLTPMDQELIQEAYIDVLKKRLAHQPKGFSSGSFFKNPKPGEVFSGGLIEEAGLKGFSLGGMKISEQHANYFINYNNGTIEDLLSLKQHIEETILEQYSIQLESEVYIITAT